MQIYRYQLSFKISKAKCLQRNSGCFLSLPSEFPSAAACSSEWLLNFFFQSLEAKFPLDGRTTLGFIAVNELLLAPGPQGGSANLVAGRTLYMVNTWGGICEKQCLNTLHGALPCCLPEKNILYIDIVYQYIKVFPYMGKGHNRQISCEIKWNLHSNLCALLCLKKYRLHQGVLSVSGAFLTWVEAAMVVCCWHIKSPFHSLLMLFNTSNSTQAGSQTLLWHHHFLSVQ